jgi:hypothetical protein
MYPARTSTTNASRQVIDERSLESMAAVKWITTQRVSLTGSSRSQRGLDAPGMARIATEWRSQEDANHLEGLFPGVHPGTDADHVRVVVLPAEPGRVQVVRERGPGADHLVCSNLFAVAGPADHNAQRARICYGGLGSGDAEDGIVVLGVVTSGPWSTTSCRPR